MNLNITCIPGDGIGPEIVTEAMKALDVVGEKFGHTFNYTECYAGGNAIDKFGIPLPQETLDVCKASDSVLLGAVGGPKWDGVPSDKRPERALLGLRSNLGLFVNLADYQLGCVKGGEITKFEDFDIDFNQHKLLLETRVSGALVEWYSAIALEEDVTE